MSLAALAALWLTALDAVSSDALGWTPSARAPLHGSTFYCGNFGLLMLEAAHSDQAREILITMIRVTMMRGAQSAGVVTYQTKPSTGKVLAKRCRVVNSKRTDLCEVLMKKCGSMLSARCISAPQVFHGHTRFATSSIASLNGCHPHRWTPAQLCVHWRYETSTGRWAAEEASVEQFITHNGDLDFFDLHGVSYPLSDLQKLLPPMLHSPCAASVDSLVIAGLIDLLRTSGVWRLSVRYGYVFGGLAAAGNLMDKRDQLWSATELAQVSAAFEATWSELLQERALRTAASTSRPPIDRAMSMLGHALGHLLGSSRASDGDKDEADDQKASPEDGRSLLEAMVSSMLEGRGARRLADIKHGLAGSSASSSSAGALGLFVRTAVEAFFFQDLVNAAQQLLAGAIGSFGLVLTSSLDVQREFVVAARGQTMSVAFYPLLGVVTWGSEAAATKAAMGLAQRSTATADPDGTLDGFRYDLDDVNGEMLRIAWDPQARARPPRVLRNRSVTMPSNLNTVPENKKTRRYAMRIGTEGERGVEMFRYGKHGSVRAAHYIQHSNGARVPMLRRIIRFRTLPTTFVPSKPLSDPVGADIADIPRILSEIQADWNDPRSTSNNRHSAYTFFNLLRVRMLKHEACAHDGSVDVLLAGCEVSLWVAEQFASDLHVAFPRLNVVCLSANKLLAQLGQGFPIPATGFQFNANSHRFTNTLCLLVSHSGGTFATLNVCNLLKGFSQHIFVVTSDPDTQIARTVKDSPLGSDTSMPTFARSYVFTTFCGYRPAEPVSLTAAATHQTLTQLLLYTMFASRAFSESLHTSCGGIFTAPEVQELEGLNRGSLRVLEAMISGGQGSKVRPPSYGEDSKLYEAREKLGDSRIRAELLAQGRRWSQHILEGPIAWLMSIAYILATVTSGYTPLRLIVGFVSLAATGDFSPPAASYLIGFVDSFIYAFLPWWTTVLLRLIQRRPWLHRVAGRTILIGDIPWVAQSVEAFVSKCFALSFSISTVSVASANPIDHLLHRHTHRVVRGSLLAVGRPDGRLNALASAESAVCLAVNQASSIQTFGVTCESFTLGHNPYSLNSTQTDLHIPTARLQFISEFAIDTFAKAGGRVEPGMSSSSMIGILSSLEGNLFDGIRRPIVPPLPTVMPARVPAYVPPKPLGVQFASASSVASAGCMQNCFSCKSSSASHPKGSAFIRPVGAQSGAGSVNGTADCGFSSSSGSLSTSRNGLAPLAMNLSRHGPLPNGSRHGLDDGSWRDEWSTLLSEASIAIQPFSEPFVGVWMADDKELSKLTAEELMLRQGALQRLYEGRTASLERFVGFVVLFHEMAKRVQDWWSFWSLGLFTYDMSRSHSIMRIASTASPVSGSEVRLKMIEHSASTARDQSVDLIQSFWRLKRAARKMAATAHTPPPDGAAPPPMQAIRV